MATESSELARMVDEDIKLDGSEERGDQTRIKLVSSLDNYILKDGGIVIEIFGPPKSGKTWQIKRLIEYLETDSEFTELKPDFDYRVFKISLKDERSKDDRYNFHMCYAQAHAYNLRRLRQRKKHADVSLIDIDLVVADRGPIDDNVWPHAWYAEGKMTLDQRNKALQTSEEAEGFVNASILMYISPEEALRREDEKTLEVIGYTRRGEVMNEHTLAVLCELYGHAGNKMPYRSIDARGNKKDFILSKKRPIFVDTEKGRPLDNAKYIYKKVFELFVPTTDEYQNGSYQNQSAEV